MTIGASTNAVDLSGGTNRGPVVHFSREDKPSSPSSALPTQAGEMTGHVDAVVSIPKARAIDGHELGSTDSTSLRHPPEERTLLLTSLNRPMPTPPYVLPVPPVRPAPYTFRLLQQWEGTVTEVADGEFSAELRDLTDPANYREEATFELDEVSPDDQLLLALGAVFRWSIGYKTSNAGQRERVSQIRFVRIPGWRKSAVEEIERRATQLQERFPLT